MNTVLLNSGSGASRGDILALQDAMLALPQIECPVKHHFAPGTYAREIFLPTDAAVVGKIHKHGHLNIVTRGLVTVATEFGTMNIDAREAPVTFASLPGTKRALYVHEDTIWMTVHLTNETDLEKIEAEIIAPSYELLTMSNGQIAAQARAA